MLEVKILKWYRSGQIGGFVQGISFALQVMQLTLASLLHAFEFARPIDEPIDMVEGFGSTNFKPNPLVFLSAQDFQLVCIIDYVKLLWFDFVSS